VKPVSRLRMSLWKVNPDKNGDPAKMQAVNKAYAVLKDPEKRKHYDSTGEEQAPDRTLEKTMSVVTEILSGIINRDPANIKQALEKLRDTWEVQYNSKIEQDKAEIQKLEKFRERIVKAPDQDIIGSMLQQRINTINKGIENLTADFEIRIKAFDMIYQYEFKNRPEQAMMYAHGGMTFTYTGTNL